MCKDQKINPKSEWHTAEGLPGCCALYISPGPVAVPTNPCLRCFTLSALASMRASTLFDFCFENPGCYHDPIPLLEP